VRAMSDPTSPFWMWMNWFVQLVVAVGTVGAVVVALFSDYSRRKLCPPQLSLALHKPHGEKTIVGLKPPEQDPSCRAFKRRVITGCISPIVVAGLRPHRSK
jgi:hypothetical protein